MTELARPEAGPVLRAPGPAARWARWACRGGVPELDLAGRHAVPQVVVQDLLDHLAQGAALPDRLAVRGRAEGVIDLDGEVLAPAAREGWPPPREGGRWRDVQHP